MKEYIHNMNVSGMDENEAKAVVLSLRTLLSFEMPGALSYEHLHKIAYLNDKGTVAFLEALDSD